MGLGHAPVHCCGLQRLRGLLVVAEGVNVYARHQCDRKLAFLWRCITLGSCVDHFLDLFSNF